MNLVYSRPTVYRGVEMRSRLEAAWAEQFDALCWTWDYEPVCLAGPQGQYLPDFLVGIPGSVVPIYFEVKGGWWEDPVARGWADDDDGWDKVYEAIFAAHRLMSELVASHDPTAMFCLAAARHDSTHTIEAWVPGDPGFMSTTRVNVCRCPEGCTSLVEHDGTVCVAHEQFWHDVDLVSSLHGTQRRRVVIADDLPSLLRTGRWRL